MSESNKSNELKGMSNEDLEQKNSITMIDVLEEEKELEDDANAVLGASDPKNCTYLQGYVKRQALYSCSTCTTTDRAAICLACSYDCHEGHDLVELYTKRNFRCDCGNSKFSSNPCKFFEKKSPINENNSYNQNFNAKYCTCSRPYPDPDDEVPDEMIQCILCEDWYHSRHLNCNVPENEDYGEMSCGSCMNKHYFLWAYQITDNVTKVRSTDETSEVVLDDKEKTEKKLTDNCETKTVDNNDMKRKLDVDNECYLKTINYTKSERSGAAFWHDGWRNKLCKCSDCMNTYKDQNLEFLLDPEDTVHSYEEQGKTSQNGTTQYDQGMNALSRMDRIKQVEAIQGYNSMKTALKDYLQKFATNGKIVKEEDIREFFGQMESNKKQRVEPPHFCK